MTDSDVCIRARIRLLRTEDGGRSSAIRGGSSYRPNHNFFGPANREMAVAPIDLPAGTTLQPGETIDLELTFINWAWPQTELRPGREWLIQEGAHVVGTGTVLHASR